jgi:toxin ParE1/3/4
MKGLIIRPEAEADVAEAAVWYESREAGLGLEFMAEIRAAIRRAIEHPLAYSLLRKRPQVRRILSRRFPYNIFYIVASETIVVFAVLRASRHDKRWRERLRSERETNL